MSDWSPCECGHLGVSHSADGPCVASQDGRCECKAFEAVRSS